MHGDMDIVDPLIEEYLGKLAPPDDPIEQEMRRHADERGGFPIVGPLVGRVLFQLTRMIGGRRVFEFGSGFGYSALWFAKAVGPGGKVYLTDGDAENVRRSKDYLARAGLGDRVVAEVGNALDVVERAGPEPFDVMFVDLDKTQYPAAFDKALPRLRKGGLLIADNVLWGGAPARGATDKATMGIVEFTRKLYGTPGLVANILPLRDGVGVGLKE
jgi:predicted O-methyltransferase YrrM